MKIPQTIAAMTLLGVLSGCGNSDPSNQEPSVSGSGETSNVESPILDIWTPAFMGDLATLKSRLDAGMKIDTPDPDYEGTALAYAADAGQAAAVKMLLEAGADPNARNGNGSTPALGAALFGRPECLEILLDAGADPTLADENEATAFSVLTVPWEMTKGLADLMEMPLERESFDRGREACWKLLGPRVDIWIAAATGELTALRNNLANGVDVDTPDPEGKNRPLSIATNFGQIEAVKFLLKEGADPNARNGNGSTAAIGAAFLGRPECLRLLLDAGADPSLADENGTTTFTALVVPWPITKAIADAFMLPLDKDALDAGRKDCGLILESR